MIDKHQRPTKLLWIDLEMTGLDPARDVILEVAAEVTDFRFTRLDGYESLVRQPRDIVLERLGQNAWWQAYPENREAFVNKSAQGTSSDEVERALLALVARHFGDEPAVLAGNSIHKDRSFITAWWPALNAKLHYRMLDVSSLKVYMQGAYGVEFTKQESHRALGDIRESIAEWNYYMEWLRNNHSAVPQAHQAVQ